MKTKINSLLALIIMMLASLGCESNISFTTANISDLKFGTNKTADPQSDIFSPNDVIYIVSEVNNTASKHKVKAILYFDDVNGRKPGAVAANFEELEVPGEYSFHFLVYAKSGQLPTGRYRAEAVLLDEYGKREIDRKEAVFDVVGAYER